MLGIAASNSAQLSGKLFQVKTKCRNFPVVVPPPDPPCKLGSRTPTIASGTRTAKIGDCVRLRDRSGETDGVPGSSRRRNPPETRGSGVS